jgi:2-aminoadipate transaminase
MAAPTQPRFSNRRDSLVGSIIDSSTAILASQTHDIVRFAMGAPDESLIPMEQLNQAYATPVSGRYDYGSTEGERPLREQIMRVSEALGTPTTDDRLLVTTGAMQGLDLAFKLTVNPGDLVAVESPTYTNGNATALSYGAELLGVPVDDGGMVVEALPELVEKAGRTPSAIYTVPNFQNPSGVTLTRKRREMLLELAERWNATIIDDDPYGLLRFSGDSVPSFSAIAPQHPLVFQVRTFSKVVAPGLRTGWIDVHPELQKLAINAKQAMDTCTNVPVQWAVTKFLEEDHLASHLERIRPIYRERKNAMRESIERHLGDRARATNPDGGLFLWLTLTGEFESVDTEEVFNQAIQDGVAYIPGPAFTADGSLRNQLRLSFATSDPDRIDEGVKRLTRSLEKVV